MPDPRKWRKPVLTLIALIVLTQVGVSVLARTQRVHDYLVAHLQRSFGRPVEVRHFNVMLFPAPTLEAKQVTVAEDPAFGNEYFLRADQLSAGLRWTGLLRGHFEFGTLSLSYPSLTLVHNSDGSWNLERWLPPTKPPYPGLTVRMYGPQPAASPANHLQKIDIDDGRIDFIAGDEKLPFAFTSVSGSVEQIVPGRWRLQIEAQPWRSGAALQSAGTMYVRGDVAGTSARLQPAEIHVHWEDGSLADLFRLFRGDDYGVRGRFAIDAIAKSAVPQPAASASVKPGDWNYSLQARASEIHRWDLSERRDNPAVNIDIEGHWNALSRTATAERLMVQTPKSNFRGTMDLAGGEATPWELRVDSAAIQASDVLAWYRAFFPGVDHRIFADDFVTGSATIRGWPFELDHASFSSQGGSIHVPGFATPLKLSSFSIVGQRSRVSAGPLHISHDGAAIEPLRAPTSSTPKRRSTPDTSAGVEVTFEHDFAKHAGGISVQGRLDKAEDALALAAAFGHALNHGWELSGPVSGALRRNWDAQADPPGWNGHIDVAGATLQAAGLNQPLDIVKARLTSTNGARTVEISEIGGFGATWSGQIAQPATIDADSNPAWKFQLRADHLDATDLDRWVGPRARPGWLQRLLPSLLGRLSVSSTSTPATAATELLRRLNAEGELRVDEFALEKVTLSQLRATVSLHNLQLDLRGSEAQCAGGKVSAKLHASFFPRPSYDVTAQLQRVNLAQLPVSEGGPRPFAGFASGTLHLVTTGIGRDELLQNLAGKGEIKLRDVEFHGWDISASAADGEPRAGVSRWLQGDGAFVIHDRVVRVPGLRLETIPELTLIKGTIGFDRSADLSIEIAAPDQPENAAFEDRRILKVFGPIELPRLSVEKLVARQPAD